MPDFNLADLLIDRAESSVAPIIGTPADAAKEIGLDDLLSPSNPIGLGDLIGNQSAPAPESAFVGDVRNLERASPEDIREARGLAIRLQNQQEPGILGQPRLGYDIGDFKSKIYKWMSDAHQDRKSVV